MGDNMLEVFRIANGKLQGQNGTATVSENRRLLSTKRFANSDYVSTLLGGVERLVLRDCTGIGLAAIKGAYCIFVIQILKDRVELASNTTSTSYENKKGTGSLIPIV